MRGILRVRAWYSVVLVARGKNLCQETAIYQHWRYQKLPTSSQSPRSSYLQPSPIIKCQSCHLKIGQTTSPFLPALQLHQEPTLRTLLPPPLVPLHLPPPTILLGLKLRPRHLLDIRFWDLCALELVHLLWGNSRRHQLA